MSHVLRRLGVTLVLTLFLASACAPADEAPLVVALEPHADPDRTLAARDRLAAFLGERLRREVQVVVPSSSQVVVEGMRGGAIDLAYLSSGDLARHRATVDLLLATEIDGKTSYASYWVARIGSRVNAVGDLEGQPVVFASRTSIPGFVVPLWDLRQTGRIGPDGRPEDFFGEGNVLFGAGCVSAIEKVLAGEAVAAAVSSFVLDGEEHFDEEVRVGLKVVDTQGPVPTDVLATRRGLDERTRTALREALLALDAPERRDLRAALFESRLVAVDADDHLIDLGSAIEFAERIAVGR